MTTVQSVTGPIEADELGITLPHEHVFINMSPTEPRDGFMTVWEERQADIERFVAAGGRTLLDVTNGELSDHAAPVYFDRDPAHQVQNPVTGSRSVANVLATKAMAEATGVNVVLGTGHYFEEYFDRRWFDRNSTEQIARYLIADLEDEIPGTGVRAGFVGEIASDLPYVTAREERSFRAAGRAAARTGVMVSTHAPTFPTAETQIDILVQEGVDPSRIVIGHTDTVKALQYSIDLLERGVYVEYDCMMAVKSGGVVAGHELERRVSYLKALIERGHGDRILLSQDVSQRSHQAALGGPGLTFIFDEFADAAVAAGIERAALERIWTDNPRRVLFGE
ncbi:putative phosphotriesterase [Patulibacter medicamentivorans]|uniref:Putative phosphotriesterase n=1 Tax=Patulibacter medicamentivorans TaxID=1097667 RepID=H0EAE6_9ACTN|nr:phosphotriesterase [Patulibacter medicamentivorans]EHN09362.1 putative phosphotriesterase [Patulibacter medicamentivorans]